MNERNRIVRIADAEQSRLFSSDEKTEFITLHRPDPQDETDRIGRELAKRLLESGVCEIL